MDASPPFVHPFSGGHCELLVAPAAACRQAEHGTTGWGHAPCAERKSAPQSQHARLGCHAIVAALTPYSPPPKWAETGSRIPATISVSWVIRNEWRIRSGVITSDAGRAGRLARLSLTTLSASTRRALSDGALGVFQLELGEEHQLRKYLCTVFRRTQSSDH